MVQFSMAEKLKGRRLAFAIEYLKNGKNGYKAALEAGYNEASAGNAAYRLLKKDDICAFIEQSEKKAIKRCEVTVDKVLMGIDEIANSDLADAFNENNSLLPMKDIPPHIRRCIASVTIEDLFDGHGKDRHKIGTTTEIKLWPKTKAQEMLGRHLKMFTDKVEVSANVGFADQLKAARERSLNAKKPANS